MDAQIQAPGLDVSTRMLVLRILSAIPLLLWVYYVCTSWSDPYSGLSQFLFALFPVSPFAIIGLGTIRTPIPRWALGLAILLGTGAFAGAALACLFTLPSESWESGLEYAAPFLLASVLAAAYIWTANSIYSRVHGPRRHPRLQAISLVTLVTVALAAGVLVPKLLRSCCSTNDGSAVGSLRIINTAEVTYSSTYPETGFTELQNLGGSGGSSAGAGLIDNVLAGGAKSGYNYRLAVGPGAPAKTYTIMAVPKDQQSGVRAYCSDQSGVIRYSEKHDGDQCLKTGTPLQ